eukprot:gene6513-7257_t
MKRVHPDDQENVYPGSRNPSLAHFRHQFERIPEVARPQFPASHLAAGPAGPTPGGQPSGSSVHPHQQGQNVHVQAPYLSQSSAASQVTGQQHFQRLKVEDALSYLDQVKLQFGSQPHVYNEFLDIMKEFKSQTIDTPGVISRVSTLFKGHPDLIVGFNTFLPPGYKIEVNIGTSNTISVHGPGTNNIHTIIQTNEPPPSQPTSVKPPHVQHSSAGVQASSFSPSPHGQQQPQQQQQPSSQQQQQQQSSGGPPSRNLTEQQQQPQPSHQGPPPPQQLKQSPQHSTLASLSSQQQQQQQPSQPAPQLPQQQQQSQAAPLPSPGAGTPSGGGGVNKAQHHAINYVTKIKNRFQGQPEVYQKFLDILNNYQTEQKNIKENAVDSFGRPLTEQEIYAREGKLANEVYQQVAKLFQSQEDLLQEFSQFLPDAGGSHISISQAVQMRDSVSSPYIPPMKKQATSSNASKQKQTARKNSSTPLTTSLKSDVMDTDSKDGSEKIATKKKHRSALKDVSLAEAVKHGTFSEFAFFNKVRKALKSQEVYDNFLRCLVLFNQEVVSRPELIQLMTSFLGKFPDLFTWFKMFLGYKENQPIDPMSGFKDRGTGGELAHLEIDYASCKRSGASYRALPQSYNQPKCTGRSQLCKETLNDVWVSLPSWSEDTQFPGTRKTQYEEYIYKCEDERFELDIVIETNLSAIKALEAVHKKIFR